MCDMFFYETSYGYLPGGCIRDKGAVTVAGVKDQMELFEITCCTWIDGTSVIALPLGSKAYRMYI